jgi:hypothetical protein
MTWFYAMFLALNVAVYANDPNPISVYGAVFCGAMFLASLAGRS